MSPGEPFNRIYIRTVFQLKINRLSIKPDAFYSGRVINCRYKEI